MRAFCGPTSSRCAPAGTACTRRSASRSPSTTGSRRPSPRATSRCAAAHSTARSTSWRCFGLDPPSGGRGARPRPPLAHALRGGLRHLAVRRGVAVGGHRVRVPAAPRRARGSADDARPHARAVRPARGDAGRGRRALPPFPARPPRADEAFEAHGRDLLGAFARLDAVELWTSAATHGLLPLIATDAGVRLQVATGTAAHMRRFGDWRGGFWLPECAYVPGLERELADHGVRAFCVDQTGVAGFDHLTPVTTEAGPVAVPVDWDAVQLIWHDQTGYPADETYRDYWGGTVHDLKPWNNAGQPYDHEAALALARRHARDFVRRVAERLAGGGLLCCALDTELLGHWWYEGLAWLGAVFEEAEAEGVRLATVSEGIELVEPLQRAIEPSTW